MTTVLVEVGMAAGVCAIARTVRFPVLLRGGTPGSGCGLVSPADNRNMRRFGVRGDPEEEAIRLYNRVRRGGRWPESYWERPGRIRAAWAILDYWLRRVRGSERPAPLRQADAAQS